MTEASAPPGKVRICNTVAETAAHRDATEMDAAETAAHVAPETAAHVASETASHVPSETAAHMAAAAATAGKRVSRQSACESGCRR
jgi:hypothetical protein